ncbi:hypothetical protein AALP_AA6G105700 [Arabis alpina]|uniref:Hyaluronan/mRNA-binding protein domain-containing protein n=1 Tax=Arabis alpina TaxID=50452 RepID=A0A087GND8_ARAAL|nr:hypothetical protein AALP_AA6G105700 [Arabis alpina]
MATLNPFDLLGDDAEDPSQLAASLPKKVEKAAPVLPAKGVKFPTKPPPPSQAVRESRNGPSGGRGAGGRGPARGRGGGFNRDFRNNDAPANENGYSRGYNRASEEGDGARRGGTVGGYRAGSGRGGGRHGEFANGESGDVDRPRRHFERRSGTGRGNDLKREGGGRGNWGTTEDDIPPATEEPMTEVEKSPVTAEKQEGEDETTDAKKETPAEEEEEKQMTLEEYEKIQEEKKKAMQGAKVEERKVDTKVFESMQQLSNKKSNEEIFIKLGSEKRKDATEKEEKARKSLSINEFLKPADGESYNPRGGYRGRGGGRGGRGGQRDGRGNGGGNQRFGGAAPAIGDNAQFPTLGK